MGPSPRDPRTLWKSRTHPALTTDDAKVDAIYNYVSTQIRYIAVSFGIGRLQPHTAAEVFRNRYGDCKDKHTLLQAMLAAEKIEAEPVLIHSSMRLNPGLPIPSQFDRDHAGEVEGP